MTTPQPRNSGGSDPRFAPWWVYLIVILGANYARAALVPGDSLPVVAVVAVAVVQALVLFVLVTVVWRVVRRP